MAHELTIRADNTAEMAYVGGKPWHGLGQLLTEGASIEEWQTAAGMNWKVRRSKVRYFADAAGAQQLEIADQHVLMRSDTKAPLGIVSAKYKVVQPNHVLEFFRDLVEGAGFRLTTAGTLFGGRKYWALASIGEEASIVGGDMVRGFLLLATSADGSSSTVGKFVAERVVCNNTLTMAMREGSKQVTASHRSSFSPSAMKDQLGIARGQFATTIQAMRQLTQVHISDMQAETFVRGLLRPEDKQTIVGADAFIANLKALTSTDDKRAPRGEADILRLFRGDAKGSALPGVRGTAWGLLNAVTEYVDHHASAKTDSHRMASAWFNGGDDLKSGAFAQLLALA